MSPALQNKVDLRLDSGRLGMRVGVSLLLFAGVLFVSLEVGLRIQGNYSDRLLYNTAPRPDGYPEFDERFGHILRPNASGVCHRTEYSYPIRSNALGFRDENVPESKDPDEFRLWVLGDSIVAGYGVREEQRFTERLETTLNTAGAGSELERGRIRVVNSGVGGYGTWHETAVLEHFIDRVSPDGILLVFATVNDFQDNLSFSRWKRDGGDYYLFPPPSGPFKSFLRDHFYTYHLLGSLARWKSREGTVTDEMRRTTNEALRTFRTICAKHGVPLTIALAGTLRVFEDIEKQDTLNANSHRAAVDILTEGGYRFIDTIEQIRADRNCLQLFYPIDRHPTAEGHARLAAILAEADFRQPALRGMR